MTDASPPVAPDASPSGELDPEVWTTFVTDLSLAGIDVIELSGERLLPGQAASTNYVMTASYQVEDELVRYRFEVKADIGNPKDSEVTDSEPEILGQVKATVIVAVTAPTIPPGPYLEEFGRVSGGVMATPYLRECLASTAQRLNFLGVLLPALKFGPHET